MFSDALPTDEFWDSILGQFVPAYVVIQLANGASLLGDLMQENLRVAETVICWAENQELLTVRNAPELLLRNCGIEPSSVQVDQLRNRELKPMDEGMLGVQRALIKKIEDQGPPQPIDESQLTVKDREAIERLCLLRNFLPSRAMQAYLMCMKKEAWARDHLMLYNQS
jgi:hypothetical protein